MITILPGTVKLETSTRPSGSSCASDGYDTGERQIHSFSMARFNAQVARFRRARGDGGAPEHGMPLIVYRGYSPFVGAGRELNAWSTARLESSRKVDT